MKKVTRKALGALLALLLVLGVSIGAFAVPASDSYTKNSHFKVISSTQANYMHSSGAKFVLYCGDSENYYSQYIGANVLEKWMNEYGIDIYGLDENAEYIPAWAYTKGYNPYIAFTNGSSSDNFAFDYDNESIEAYADKLNVKFSTFYGKKIPTEKPINLKYHTQSEIKAYIKSTDGLKYTNVTYDVTPNVSKSVQGRLSSETLNGALTRLNQIRYVAGINPVKLDASYSNIAQIGTLTLAMNNTGLTHYPSKPAGMPDELYAQQGCGKSNLGMGYSTLEGHIMGCLDDEDDSNIDSVGHRRWLLNPSMGKTGFGYVNAYSATYSFDQSGTVEYYGVTWPAANTPIEMFNNNPPWSISVRGDLNTTKVKLTRLSDNKVWNFYKGCKDGYFNYENGNYGEGPCIIFRPTGITYKHGDSFKVEVTGVVNATYTVCFFTLDDSAPATDIIPEPGEDPNENPEENPGEIPGEDPNEEPGEEGENPATQRLSFLQIIIRFILALFGIFF